MKDFEEFVRNEDMSPDGILRLYQQMDGDIVIACHGHTQFGEPCEAHVEFCAMGFGGGRSPNTRAALIELMKAIEKDNQEHPIVN